MVDAVPPSRQWLEKGSLATEACENATTLLVSIGNGRMAIPKQAFRPVNLANWEEYELVRLLPGMSAYVGLRLLAETEAIAWRLAENETASRFMEATNLAVNARLALSL